VSKPKYQKEVSPSKVFSVKPERDDISEVPSITKLLNRKKIVSSTGTISRLTPPDSPVSDRHATKLTPVSKVTAIQKGSRRSTAKSAPLAEWKPSELNQSPDSMKQAIHALYDVKLIQSALYLENAPTVSGGVATPSFVAVAAVSAKAKHTIWKGLQWDPQVFPEVWKVLTTKGYAEFQPGIRNANCAVFAVDGMSWLTLIRVGSTDRCEGLVAIISQASLVLPLSKVLHHFTKESMSFAPKKKAA
jgi:hypothetical protein